MLRIVLAAILGYALIGVLIFGTDQIYAALKVSQEWYFFLAMATDTVYTFIGGWACGRISRGDRQSTWGLILIGELMGIVSTAVLWKTAPHYYSFYLLIMYPLAVWFGAKRGRPVSA